MIANDEGQSGSENGAAARAVDFALAGRLVGSPKAVLGRNGRAPGEDDIWLLEESGKVRIVRIGHQRPQNFVAKFYPLARRGQLTRRLK